MKKSSKVESEGQSKYLALIQQYKNLENKWKSLEKPKPRKKRTCSISSDSSTITSFDEQLLENSPRELMSSLQKSPSDRFNEEILMRDRRTAIMSGKLEGRRLFGAVDMIYGGGDDWLNNKIQEREVLIMDNDGSGPVVIDQSCSYSDSNSPLEEKRMVVEVAEKRGSNRRLSGGGGGGGGGGGLVTVMALFAVVLLVISVGKYAQKNELILVPT